MCLLVYPTHSNNTIIIEHISDVWIDCNIQEIGENNMVDQMLLLCQYFDIEAITNHQQQNVQAYSQTSSYSTS